MKRDLTIHRFVEGDGMVVDDGKPVYPAMLRLEVSRRRALEMISHLAVQLRETDTIQLTMFGTISQEFD